MIQTRVSPADTNIVKLGARCFLFIINAKTPNRFTQRTMDTGQDGHKVQPSLLAKPNRSNRVRFLAQIIINSMYKYTSNSNECRHLRLQHFNPLTSVITRQSTRESSLSHVFIRWLHFTSSNTSHTTSYIRCANHRLQSIPKFTTLSPVIKGRVYPGCYSESAGDELCIWTKALMPLDEGADATGRRR